MHNLVDIQQKELKLNNLIKHTGSLLKSFEKGLLVVDYFPSRFTGFPFELVELTYEEKRRYIKITEDDPLKRIRKIFNCVDDFCVEEWFMSEKELFPYMAMLDALRTSKEKLRADICSILAEEEQRLGVEEIIACCQAKEILPVFFPKRSYPYLTAEMVIPYIESTHMTFYDLIELKNIVTISLLETKKEMGG